MRVMNRRLVEVYRSEDNTARDADKGSSSRNPSPTEEPTDDGPSRQRKYVGMANAMVYRIVRKNVLTQDTNWDSDEGVG